MVGEASGGEVIYDLDVDESKLKAGLKKSEKRIKDSTSKSQDSMDRFEQSAGLSFANVGKSAALGLGAVSVGVAGIGIAAVGASMQFNEAMANVATLIPGNIERVNELKETVQDMSIEMGKSTNDMADGLFQVISAFGDTADTVSILEINAKGATAGMATTTDAINLTSAVTKAYGTTTAEGVQRVTDLALMTSRLGQTTFPELAASIGVVTPLTAELGVSQESLFGAMATFTGVTGGASEVSTQLRGVLQALMVPTADMTELFNDMGVESGKAFIEQDGLNQVIKSIVEAAEESGKPLQSFIGSIEGQTLALAASGGQADAFSEKISQMGVSAGAADEAFAEVTGGVNKAGFAWKRLKAIMEVGVQRIGDAVGVVAFEVFETIGPIAQQAMEQLLPVMDSLVNFLGPQLQALIPAVMPLLESVGATLLEVFQAVAPHLQESAEILFPALKEGFIGISEALGPLIESFGGMLISLAPLLPVFANLISFVLPMVTTGIKLMAFHFRTAAEVLNLILGPAIAFVAPIIQGFIDVLKVLEGIATDVIDAAIGIGNAIVDGIVEGIKSGAGKIKDAAKDAAKGALSEVTSFLGIGSPSKVFMEVGKFTAEGMALGIDSGAQEVNQSVDDLLNGVTTTTIDSAREGVGEVSNATTANSQEINIIVNVQGSGEGVGRDIANEVRRVLASDQRLAAIGVTNGTFQGAQ